MLRIPPIRLFGMVKRIIDKLKVSDRTQAAVRAVELGLLPPSSRRKATCTLAFHSWGQGRLSATHSFFRARHHGGDPGYLLAFLAEHRRSDRKGYGGRAFVAPAALLHGCCTKAPGVCRGLFLYH